MRAGADVGVDKAINEAVARDAGNARYLYLQGRVADAIGKADVFVQNLKPGALAKLGFAIDRRPMPDCGPLPNHGSRPIKKPSPQKGSLSKL